MRRSSRIARSHVAVARSIVVAALGVIFATSFGTAADAATSGPAAVIRLDVAGSTFVCPGDTLTVTSGTLQIVLHEVLTPSGSVHVINEGSVQGVKALSSTGATYEIPGGFSGELNATAGATTETHVGTLNVVGQGGAPNFLVRDVVHLTIDANGNVTASVDSHSGSCTIA